MLTLRAARAADTPAIAELLVQLYHTEMGRAFRGPRSAQVELVRYTLERGTSALFRRYVAVSPDGQLLATASLRFEYDSTYRITPSGTTRLAFRLLGVTSAFLMFGSLFRAGLAPETALPTRGVLVHSVVVSEAARGQGIGRWMMHAMEPLAREGGAQSMELRVMVGNKPAKYLYERVGYRLVSRTPRWMDAITYPTELMRKYLL